MTAVTEPAGTSSPPSDGPDFAAVLRWGLLILGALALVALGAFYLLRRPEPPPVIKEVPAFAFTHHDGSTLTREDLAGEPWIADFIFTRCAAICPRMTAQMKRVKEALGEGSAVKIASFSVDPEHDTPQVLADYAAKHGAGDGWYFLTGDKQSIYDLCREGFLLGVQESSTADAAPADAGADPADEVDRADAEAATAEADAPADDPIIHSNRFVLVDRQNRIRGYYDPFDEAELDRLLSEVRTVLKER